MATVDGFRRNLRPVAADLHPWARVREARVIAAERMARFIALGALERDECVGWLVGACVLDGYRGSIRGLQTRFCWILNDHTAAWERKQDQATRAISRRLAPMLDAHEPSAALVEAARDENRAIGFPLTRGQVEAITAEAVARFVRNLQWQRRNATGGRRYG